MLPVISQKVIQSPPYFGLARLRSQGAPDQDGSTISNIGIHPVVFQGRQSHVLARSVHCVRQIKLGVDQCAVKVENEEVQVLLSPMLPIWLRFVFRGRRGSQGPQAGYFSVTPRDRSSCHSSL